MFGALFVLIPERAKRNQYLFKKNTELFHDSRNEQS